MQVAEGLYVSGAAVAQDRAILAAHGISHVVNCVGALYTEYFKDDGVAYKTLWLQGEQFTERLAGGSLIAQWRHITLGGLRTEDAAYVMLVDRVRVHTAAVGRHQCCA